MDAVESASCIGWPGPACADICGNKMQRHSSVECKQMLLHSDRQKDASHVLDSTVNHLVHFRPETRAAKSTKST